MTKESEKRKNKKSIKILLEITYKIEYHEWHGWYLLGVVLDV